MNEEGLRYNQGKVSWRLFPPRDVLVRYETLPRRALEAIAQVSNLATPGKYPEHNWAKGMKWSRCFDSATRHYLDVLQGKDVDELGSFHLANYCWNLFALYHYMLNGKGEDDRPDENLFPEWEGSIDSSLHYSMRCLDLFWFCRFDERLHTALEIGVDALDTFLIEKSNEEDFEMKTGVIPF